MARDILMDIGKGDLLINDRSNQNEPCFVGEWSTSGNLKVCIPTSFFKKNNLDFKHPGAFSFRVNIPFYNGENATFFFFVYVFDEENPNYTLLVYSEFLRAYIFDGKLGSIKHGHFPLIDIDHEFRICHTEDNKMIIYSAKETDFTIGNSDNQVAQLLSLCAPGKYYRYPTTGIDITKYINTAVVNTDLAKTVTEQFDADGMSVQEMSFDSVTGDMKVLFSGGRTDDGGSLLPIDALDLESISVTDEMIEEAGENIDLDSIFEYSDLLPEYEYSDLLPDNVNPRACFSGTWVGCLPWLGDFPWIGE